MSIRIRVDSMRAAEEFSEICKGFPNGLSLRSGQYRIDPKSTLGLLALMYSAKNEMYLDTGDLEDRQMPRFLQAIDAYTVKEGE